MIRQADLGLWTACYRTVEKWRNLRNETLATDDLSVHCPWMDSAQKDAQGSSGRDMGKMLFLTYILRYLSHT